MTTGEEIQRLHDERIKPLVRTLHSIRTQIDSYQLDKCNEKETIAKIQEILEGVTEPEVHPIDNVTTDNLRDTLRICGMEVNIDLLDKIIDIVELLVDKGGNKTTLKDIYELQKEWE